MTMKAAFALKSHRGDISISTVLLRTKVLATKVIHRLHHQYHQRLLLRRNLWIVY